MNKLFIDLFDGSLNEIQFVLSIACIILCVMNILMSGRPGVGLSVLLYRASFCLIAFIVGSIYYIFDEQNIEPRISGLLLIFSICIHLSIRLYAVRADIKKGFGPKEVVEERKTMSIAEKTKDWVKS